MTFINSINGVIGSRALGKQQKLTLTGLAKLAGVSPSTVSRALHDNPLIKKETRERLQALAKEHNFSLNHAASRLRTQKTNVVAVILNFTNHTEQSTSDPFLLKIVGALNQALNKAGFDLLLSNSLMATSDWADYFIHSRRADGLIIIGQGKSSEKIDAAAKARVPMVIWGTPTLPTPYPVVGSDNHFGGYTATKHLLQGGCRHILFLGDPEHAEMAERYAGYQQALDEAGIALTQKFTVSIDITSVAAYEKVSQLIVDDGLYFDGIVTVSDMVALGAIKALKERYINIPAEVGIVGFDDIAMAELFHPALTTIRQDTDLAAKMMVEQLNLQFLGKQGKSQMVEIELIKRMSSR